MKKNILIIILVAFALIFAGCSAKVDNDPVQVSKQFVSAYLDGDYEKLATLVSKDDAAEIMANKGNFEVVQRLEIKYTFLNEKVEKIDDSRVDVVHKLKVSTKTTEEREKALRVPLKKDGNKWIIDISNFALSNKE